MRCKGCKKTIEDDSNYCRFCGVKLVKDRVSVPTPKKTANGYTAQLMVNGKRIRVTEPTLAKYEARAVAIKTELLAEAATPSAMKLGKAIDSYIESRTSVLSASTVLGYQRIRHNRFQPEMERSINSINWQAAINREAKSVNAKTLANAVNLCRAAVEQLGCEFPKVTLPQRVKPDKRFLTAAQAAVLVKACNGHRSEAAILLGLMSLRCSEILAVNKADIHDGVLDVHGAVVIGPDGLTEQKQNKTMGSRRSIPLLFGRLADIANSAEDGKLVKLTQAQIYKDVNKLCRENGLPEVGIHGLRHTFASICYNDDIPIKTVQRMGGWATPTIPTEVYSHLSDERLTEDQKRLLEIYSKIEKSE